MKSEAGTYTFRKTETHMWVWFEGELAFKYEYDRNTCTMREKSYGVRIPIQDTVSLHYRDIVRDPGKCPPACAKSASLVDDSRVTSKIFNTDILNT